MLRVLSYEELLHSVDQIDPVLYARTRNHSHGAVTGLSPYISRGVISTRFVFERLVARGWSWKQMEKLVQELAWRDYFQRVWQHSEPSLQAALRKDPGGCVHGEVPVAVMHATTGIDAVDRSIFELYRKGYIHNHMRMYIASICCNLAKAHWEQSARWMYYHLLDGDWGSNACSWQWVAGCFSSKRYFANQDNINRYFETQQSGTFLDRSYEELERSDIPGILAASTPFFVDSVLPESDVIEQEHPSKILLYNWYNLDPVWHPESGWTRILLLEPEIFEHYPIAPHSIAFMLQLARAIPGMRVFTGSFAALKRLYPGAHFCYKEHPWNQYEGICEPRPFLTDEVNGFFSGFFPYWNKVSVQLQKELAV